MCILTVHDIINAVHKQKNGKSLGSDGVSMKDINNGDIKLYRAYSSCYDI